MRKTSGRIAASTVVVATAAAGWLYACGGDDSGGVGPSDAATSDTGLVDATVPGDAAGDASPADVGAPGDAGVPCAPPSDPTKAALCVTLTAETIQFLQDPRFDGRGVLLVAAHDTSRPPDDGGGVVGTPVLLGTDGGLVDLSQPVPSVRLDGLPPSVVYPQALFIDDPVIELKTPRAGWWLGGYDYTKGLQDAPLKAVTLRAGEGTTVPMDLRALRALLLRVKATVTPAGNGQGPLRVLVIEGDAVVADSGTRVWGYGNAACANCLADGGAGVVAFFMGPGPLFTLPVLDDFGAGGDLPPGAMASLDVDLDGGHGDGAPGVRVPAANAFTAGQQYAITQSVNLNYVNPLTDAAFDDANCP